MPGNDFNRIIPGYPRDEFTAENYVELQQRVVKMERILAQKVDQWNAPSLLETLGKTEYKVQFGTYEYSFGGGATAQSFTLPSAWDTEHALFQVSIRPLTSWDGTFQLNGCGIQNLSTGTWGINGTTVQVYEICWISIGK